MKKFYMILAALLIGSVCFAQRMFEAEAIEQQNLRSDWYTYWADDGTGYVGLDLFQAGDKVAVRYPVSALAQLASNPQLTKVSLYFIDYTYQGIAFNNKNATIEVYQGGTWDAENGVYSVAPTLVGSEAVSATSQGWTDFTLQTAINIDVTQDLMIAVNFSGYTAFVMAHSEIATANGLGNLKYDAENGVWCTIMYQDSETSPEECLPWAIKIYIEDSEAHQNNSDLSAFFLDVYPNPQGVAPETMTLSETDDLVLYPAFQNNGPDAVTAPVNIDITVNGMSIFESPASFSFTEEDDLPNGYYTPISFGEGQNYVPLSLTAAQLEGITGTFNVCLTVTYTGVDNNSNNNQACIAITRGPVAVEENIADAVSVYPNPANDMFTVANAEGATIVVVNSLGQVVASIENAASNQTIDASNFANGTYFVKVNESVVKINVVK